jgi:biopolymer transport protein ExbD
MSVIPKRQRRKAEINIVPLVDVLVVLIFFFLVSMQFRNLTMLDVTLPRIETAGTNDPTRALQIGIDIDGRLYLAGNEVSEEMLINELNRTGQMDAETPVLIAADEGSLLGQVTFVMDAVRRAGLTQVRLQSR